MRRIKERLAATAQPFLEPGDEVHQAFRAGRLSPSGKKTGVNIVVGTRDAIVILGTSRWSTRKARYLVTRVPKTTPISMARGELRIGDLRYWVVGTSAHPQAKELVNGE